MLHAVVNPRVYSRPVCAKRAVGARVGIRDAATAWAVGRSADAVLIGTRLTQLIEHEPRELVAATATTF